MNKMILTTSAFHHNFRYLQSLQPHAAIFPVVKSNAYGHGLYEMAQILKPLDVKYICVDSFPEYQRMKKHTSHRILVIGETLPENYRFYERRRTAFAVYNPETIKVLGRLSGTTRLHLFLNTGMNREGVQPHALSALLALCKQFPNLVIEGVMSHLAKADESDPAFTDQQIAVFKQMFAQICDAGYSPTWKHIGSSAGIAKITDPFFTAYRAGLALYGYNHLEPEDPAYPVLEKIRPGMRVVSSVISCQALRPGDIVSYCGTYQATSLTHTITIPFGYHEGLQRALSNKRAVRWREHRLPQVGNICMNLSSYAAGSHSIRQGDEVEVIGQAPNDPNSIRRLALVTGAYEALINLDEKMKRVLVP